MADAYLYLGPVESLTLSRPSPDAYRDETLFRELERRHQVRQPGKKLSLSDLLDRPARYIDTLR